MKDSEDKSIKEGHFVKNEELSRKRRVFALALGCTLSSALFKGEPRTVSELPGMQTTKRTKKPANKTTYLYILPKIKQKRKVFDLRKSMHLFSFSFWLTLQTIGGGWLLFLD